MGTEEFWVPAALAAVSAGGQYVNQQQANSRQQSGEVQAIQDQEAIRQKANAQVSGLTKQIAQDSPAQIAGKSTGDYVSQLRKNAAGSTQGGPTTGGAQAFGQPTSALPPSSVAGANSRYGAALGAGQQQVENFGNTYAGEMGQLDAATRQRQNEGLSMQTLAGGLNTLGMQSYGTNFVDQLRSQASGQANPWISLLSNLVGGAGNQMSKNPSGYFSGPYAKYGKMPAGGAGIDAGNGLGDWAGATA